MERDGGKRGDEVVRPTSGGMCVGASVDTPWQIF